MNKSAKVGLISPWVNFYREIEALFKDDPNIEVTYDEGANVVKLYVIGEKKAEALTQLLPTERTFGSVTIYIQVIPANKLYTNRAGLFEEAFRDNPVFAYAKNVPTSFSSFGANYVVFKNRVVQYYNDDLSDINGLCSTLYQEIAKDIFGEEDVFFCTDTEEPVG